MPTNPPTPADRLAAVREEVIACLRAWEPEARVLGNVRASDLTALLAADPPGATVEVLCDCGHDGLDHDGLNGRCYCMCPTFTPTTARVSYTRALTEEERTR